MAWYTVCGAQLLVGCRLYVCGRREMVEVVGGNL